jgi:SAM-dependent methyltransferase
MAVNETGNPDQVAAWDGTAGDYWTEHEERFDDAVRAYNARLLAAAAITPHDRVLDVGCGTGWVTREAARLAWAGSALGVDLSGRMLERAAARARVERLDNAEFLQVDAQVHPFPAASFDVVISRTGAMFFSDPVAAFTNLRRAMKPRGRIALLTWQAFTDNKWIVAVNEALAVGRPVVGPPPDAPGPFSLAERDRVQRLLVDAGFVDVELQDVRAPFFLGRDADEAFAFMAGFTAWMLDGLDAAQRQVAHDRLHDVMRAHDTGLGVVFDSRGWIVGARCA